MDEKSFFIGVFAGLILAIFLYWLFSFFNIFRPWLQIFLSGGRTSVFQIVGMRLRGSDVKLVTEAYIMLVQRGKKISLSEVESQYIARKQTIMSSQDLMQLVEQNLGSGVSE